MSLRDFVDKGLLKGEPESYALGSCLYRKGDEVDFLYLLTEGSVAIMDITSGMDEQIVAPPDFLLGITDLLNTRYSFTTFTLESSKLIRIGKQDIKTALHQNPMLRLYLLKMMSWEANITKTPFE